MLRTLINRLQRRWDTIYGNKSAKAARNNSVFKRLLNAEREAAERVSGDKLFQILGADTEKALSVAVSRLLVWGTARRLDCDERKERVGAYGVNTLCK